MSWQQLIAILQEAREIAKDEAAKPPVECPNDGEPLITGPDGKLFCPWDGLVWPGGNCTTCSSTSTRSAPRLYSPTP